MYHLNPNPLNDTSPEAEAIRNQHLRDMPTWRKLEMVEELRQLALQLAWDNIREIHNTDNERLIRRLLADRILGEEMALRVYGSIDEIKKESEC